MSKLNELAGLGQSVWYDYIRRDLLTGGGLQDLIEKGVSGVTSNPAIFEKAIAGSNDYDVAMAKLVAREMAVSEIYEAMAFEDIAMAADLLRPVYKAAGGRDGFVSLEVDPALAHDTKMTVEEAKRLYKTLDRPNVMIKVPATPAGIPAIESLIAAGVNVNVTLIFGLDHYQAVAEAFIAGAERLSETGPSVTCGHAVERIASVASFFVSRVDTAVDKILEEKAKIELQGKAAVANAKVAYARYQQLFGTRRWEKLARAGAGVQRVLWASTSTKNPDYPATLYVDQLIGPDTVNTIPPSTLESFIAQGKVEQTLTRDLAGARAHLAHLAELGIDLNAIADNLQDQGVDAFARPFAKLMESISAKKNRLRGT